VILSEPEDVTVTEETVAAFAFGRNPKHAANTKPRAKYRSKKSSFSGNFLKLQCLIIMR